MTIEGVGGLRSGVTMVSSTSYLTCSSLLRTISAPRQRSASSAATVARLCSASMMRSWWSASSVLPVAMADSRDSLRMVACSIVPLTRRSLSLMQTYLIESLSDLASSAVVASFFWMDFIWLMVEWYCVMAGVSACAMKGRTMRGVVSASLSFMFI